MLDGNCLTIRRIQRLVNVVDILGIGIMEAVQLQNHMLSQLGSCGRDTTSSSQIDMIVITYLFNIAHLKDGPVQRTIETITQLLCHVTQVQVVIGNLSQVHVLTEIGVGGVWGTIQDSLGIGQITIGTLTSRGTCKDSHLEFAASLMLSYGQFCQLLGCCLGYTSWCEATHGDMIAILNQCRSLCSSHTCISHFYMIIISSFADTTCRPSPSSGPSAHSLSCHHYRLLRKPTWQCQPPR